MQILSSIFWIELIPDNKKEGRTTRKENNHKLLIFLEKVANLELETDATF